MTDLAERLIKVEQGLKTAGVSVNHVCRQAGIDRSTWHRWKNGQKPGIETWEKVLEALPEEVRAVAA